MPAEIARQKFSLIYNGTTFNVIGFVVPSEGIRPLVTPMQTRQTAFMSVLTGVSLMCYSA